MLALLFAVATTTATPQHYEFDDDQVQGGVVQPDSDVVGTAPPVRRSSLIRVRAHFLEELVRSAE